MEALSASITHLIHHLCQAEGFWCQRQAARRTMTQCVCVCVCARKRARDTPPSKTESSFLFYFFFYNVPVLQQKLL